MKYTELSKLKQLSAAAVLGGLLVTNNSYSSPTFNSGDDKITTSKTYDTLVAAGFSKPMDLVVDDNGITLNLNKETTYNTYSVVRLTPTNADQEIVTLAFNPVITLNDPTLTVDRFRLMGDIILDGDITDDLNKISNMLKSFSSIVEINADFNNLFANLIAGFEKLKELSPEVISAINGPGGLLHIYENLSRTIGYNSRHRHDNEDNCIYSGGIFTEGNVYAGIQTSEFLDNSNTAKPESVRFKYKEQLGAAEGLMSVSVLYKGSNEIILVEKAVPTDLSKEEFIDTIYKTYDEAALKSEIPDKTNPLIADAKTTIEGAVPFLVSGGSMFG